MKKLVIVYIVLIIAVILLAVFKFGGKAPSFSFFSSPQATINNTKISLLLAKSEADREKGLSGKSGLNQNQGMLFEFPKKDEYGFWMKQMLFPLDIIYIDDNTVVYIVKDAPAPTGQAQVLTIYKPDQPANYVLEVTAGTADKLKITKGTKVTFKGI